MSFYFVYFLTSFFKILLCFKVMLVCNGNLKKTVINLTLHHNLGNIALHGSLHSLLMRSL